MRRLLPTPLTVLTVLLFGAALNAEETLWSGLSPTQQARLTAGKPVMIEEVIPGNPWPRYTIYHLVQGTPKQVASVFWDSELDPQYVPNCTSVRILSRPQPHVQEAQYTLKMPFFLEDELYVSRNELHTPSPGVYELSWNVIKTRYTKGSTGDLRVEPFGDGTKTLLRYRNAVEPASRFARLLRSKAGAQVVDSVVALVRQVETEMKTGRDLVERQSLELERSLQRLVPAPSPTATP